VSRIRFFIKIYRYLRVSMFVPHAIFISIMMGPETEQQTHNHEPHDSQGSHDSLESVIETPRVHRRRLRSRVHSHFQFGPTAVVCNHCGGTLKKPKNGSTSSLITHLGRCSPQFGRHTNLFEQVSPFTDHSLRESLTRLFLKHNLPFTLMDAADFQALIRRLDPRLHPVGRGSLRRDIHDMFVRGKALVKKAIADSRSQACCQ
jgi:hypothetical protein